MSLIWGESYNNFIVETLYIVILVNTQFHFYCSYKTSIVYTKIWYNIASANFAALIHRKLSHRTSSISLQLQVYIVQTQVCFSKLQCFSRNQALYRSYLWHFLLKQTHRIKSTGSCCTLNYTQDIDRWYKQIVLLKSQPKRLL